MSNAALQILKHVARSPSQPISDVTAGVSHQLSNKAPAPTDVTSWMCNMLEFQPRERSGGRSDKSTCPPGETSFLFGWCYFMYDEHILNQDEKIQQKLQKNGFFGG